jgi:hypothetical protein
MPRRNRVDPFGDLQLTSERGMFTGNRGCLVDDNGRIVRHHNGNLWIICVTSFRGWRSPLDQPRHWTPLFFLDDAVGLAAGHRPCGLCRRSDYLSYQAAVTRSIGGEQPVPATELNRMLAGERLAPGRGLQRAGDRKIWRTVADGLPDGAVIVGADRTPLLILGDEASRFSFQGWGSPSPRPGGIVDVLTPQTSVAALGNGYRPLLHPSSAPR